ncbi:MAG TPA: sulfotransferase [Rhizomicrobium sp.]|jgi:tetratricopeptide (TPR) repeat protein
MATFDDDAEIARIVEASIVVRPLRDARLREAARALNANRPDVAEQSLSAYLKKRPRDADALNLMADTSLRLDRKNDAEELLARCVSEAPGFDAARFNYASVLRQTNKPAAALEQLTLLLKKDPRNPLYRDLEALLLAAVGNHEASLACRRGIAQDYPGSAKVLVSYAQALRTSGMRDECVAAYRRALALSPLLGTAWWGLANLKTFCFGAVDIEAMRSVLATPGLGEYDRVHLLFSLGKAYGDCGHYEESFGCYAKANAIRRLQASYDPDSTGANVRQYKSLFTPEFFRTRMGMGSDAGGPIFVVGMQRAGSTLVEQILSSHSMIEGAGELAAIRFLARHLQDRVAPQFGTDYPGVLEKLDAAALKTLGEQYLESSRVRRRAGRPFFVDKEPFNFWHVGFIHLMFPNAKIVDVRRHPLGCCFSNFTTIFLHGLALTYRLADLGRYYADYVEVMAHFDRVLPGRVHRIFYEQLVANPETQIRALLDHLGLPFEQACLEFHRNARAVNSASSEQVRSPIYDDALERWRHYEPWLGPLKSALGPALAAYPDVPATRD